jgi:methyl-accepting chemotaxis protein
VLYNTIPIVAAWQTMEKAATKEGFQFATPTAPGVRARNPKNNNSGGFAEAFKAFQAGQREYLFHDTIMDELVLARPVRILPCCMHATATQPPASQRTART